MCHGDFLSRGFLTGGLGLLVCGLSACGAESTTGLSPVGDSGGTNVDAYSEPVDDSSRGGDAPRSDSDNPTPRDVSADTRAVDARDASIGDRNIQDDTNGADRDADITSVADVGRGSDVSVDGGTDAGVVDGGGAGRDAVAPDGDAPSGGSTPQIGAPALPTVETDSFSPSGSTTDIADDSAIYANSVAPELSVVIADNKDDVTGGVGVFDMQGKLLQFRQDGKIGNVDLRAGFALSGQSIVLVGGNNRTTNTLTFWQLDPPTRQLSAPISETIPTVSPNYGFCLYHSAQSGKFYAFVTQETGASTMEQYELGENAGKVTATKVRTFDVGSITEGCVADDEMGRLYVAQEDVALWRYGAEPTAGSDRVQVGAVGDGHLVDDLEGVSLAKGPGTSGYLVLSLQGDSRFVTYDRETNLYLKEFTVGSNGTIDAVSQTDGLDICTSNLGPGFPRGALVVHDGSNTGGATSNLKYVPLQ
jgi:3-phytase